MTKQMRPDPYVEAIMRDALDLADELNVVINNYFEHHGGGGRIDDAIRRAALARVGEAYQTTVWACLERERPLLEPREETAMEVRQ